MPDPTVSLSLPLLSAAVALPVIASFPIAFRRDPGVARPAAAGTVLAAAALLVSGACIRAASEEASLADGFWPGLQVDAFNAPILVLEAFLTLVIILVAPRRDATGAFLGGLLFLFASTVIACAGTSLGLIVTGWWLSAAPFALGCFAGVRNRRRHWPLLVAITASGAAVTAAAFLLGPSELDFSQGGTNALVLLSLAVALRKGIFPFHSWLVRTFEQGSPLATVLFYNGHLGAFLIVRAESTHLAAPALEALRYLGWGALFTALFASLLMIAEKKPRRILALLCVSQAAFILAGLCSGNQTGITGALVHWMVVATASTGLVGVYRAVEVRFSGVEESTGHLGLAARAPRLAVFFLLCGLALVGLPGTLGYCAEDLLFHGALEAEPVFGLALHFATALNAIHLFRLYARLFLGRLDSLVPFVPDALPRERWPLALCVAFLILGGLFPSAMVHLQEPAAEQVATGLSLPDHPQR